ncbi:MAG TPA: L,D-transpeptidase [Spirochaetota bacterium]|nr:L,D-transpeptidase [Spirochaetota bacterium]HOM38492.1 L,D-transpeptidase [Spirochaetota bacterium]HPQ49032.1 L,D-transpeptidase [Spirochaetota bacterium]
MFKVRYFKCFLIFFPLFLFSINIDKNELQKYKQDYIIYVNKKEFKLYVLNKNLEKLEEYSVSLGLEEGRKLVAGDNKTPEGIYYVTEILSLDAPKDSIAYKKLVEMNNIYFRAKDGHFKYNRPKEDLGKNAYGPRFFRLSYPNKEDIKRFLLAKKRGDIPKNSSIGGGIAIHGTNDEPSIGHRASSGCVRLKNEDIVKLDKYIKIDTIVIIE